MSESMVAELLKDEASPQFICRHTAFAESWFHRLSLPESQEMVLLCFMPTMPEQDPLRNTTLCSDWAKKK